MSKRLKFPGALETPEVITDLLKVSGVTMAGAIGEVYFVDPANGSDSNSGKTAATAFASVAAAYAACTDANNDVVLFIPGATADNPTAAITWAKSYTHLIGLSGDLPGMGQRCRIVNTAGNDLATLFTLSGSGCIVKNIQLFDGKDKDEDAACLLLSGSRNFLKNVFVAGMGHATPAARAGSESLNLTGAENYFEDCTIGLDTIIRAAANAQIRISGQRNTFRSCMVNSYCETAGAFMVSIDNSGGDLRWNRFIDTLFYNYRENWGTAITDCFDMPASGATHDVILQGNCMLYGCTGWADTATHLIHMLAAPASGGGVGIAVNA